MRNKIYAHELVIMFESAGYYIVAVQSSLEIFRYKNIEREEILVSPQMVRLAIESGKLNFAHYQVIKQMVLKEKEILQIYLRINEINFERLAV